MSPLSGGVCGLFAAGAAPPGQSSSSVQIAGQSTYTLTHDIESFIDSVCIPAGVHCACLTQIFQSHCLLPLTHLHPLLNLVVNDAELQCSDSGTSDKGPSEIGTTSLQRTLVGAPC